MPLGPASRQEDLCKDMGSRRTAPHSPFCLLLSCLPGQFGRGKLDKKVPSSADQSLVRKVLRDLGQEVVDRGHVALTVQNFLLAVQHDLQRGARALRIARDVGTTPCHCEAVESPFLGSSTRLLSRGCSWQL